MLNNCGQCDFKCWLKGSLRKHTKVVASVGGPMIGVGSPGLAGTQLPNCCLHPCSAINYARHRLCTAGNCKARHGGNQSAEWQTLAEDPIGCLLCTAINNRNQSQAFVWLDFLSPRGPLRIPSIPFLPLPTPDSQPQTPDPRLRSLDPCKPPTPARHLALRDCLTSSFTPFGRSSRVTHVDDHHVDHLVNHHVGKLVGHLVGHLVDHLFKHHTSHLDHFGDRPVGHLLDHLGDLGCEFRK